MGPGVRRGQDSLIRFIVFASRLTLGRGAHVPRKRNKRIKKIKKKKKGGEHRGKSPWRKAVFRASMTHTVSSSAPRAPAEHKAVLKEKKRGY